MKGGGFLFSSVKIESPCNIPRTTSKRFNPRAIKIPLLITTIIPIATGINGKLRVVILQVYYGLISNIKKILL